MTTTARSPCRTRSSAQASPTPHASRRQVLELSWVIGVVVFVIIRFVIAYSTLARYGRMTVIVFGVLDIATGTGEPALTAARRCAQS